MGGRWPYLPPDLNERVEDLMTAYREWDRLRGLRRDRPFPPFEDGVDEDRVTSALARFKEAAAQVKAWLAAQEDWSRRHWTDALKSGRFHLIPRR